MSPATLTRPTNRRITPQEAHAIWAEYKRTGNRAVRDRLVMTFSPMVRYIVYKKFREVPASCDIDDFISCGLEALIHSIERFDPEKGATLEQFAWTRIHGAVLDELRRQDWRPRSLRRWEREAAKASRELVGETGREPSREEVAARMGLTVEEMNSREREMITTDVTSLNKLVASDDGTTIERIDTLESSDASADPARAAELESAKDRFRAAFARLPEREREIAVLLYVKNLTLREIGEQLGVSESRVCQIHGQLKKTLRRELDADAHLFESIAA